MDGDDSLISTSKRQIDKAHHGRSSTAREAFFSVRELYSVKRTFPPFLRFTSRSAIKKTNIRPGLSFILAYAFF